MRNTFTLPRLAANSARGVTQDRYVTVCGVRIRYHEAGREHGGPPLVLVHGYNGSCDYWYPHTTPSLATGRRVIAPDLPGNGLSGKLSKHTLSEYRRFLVGFLDALGLAQVDLLGHSMGGQIAIAAAVAHPGRFRRLVLMDSAGLPELVRVEWLHALRAMTDSSLRQVRLYPTFLKIGLRARTGREGLRMLRREGIGKLLADLSNPTLLLWGANDRVVPVSHALEMERAIPGARLVLIEGGGHMPFYEKAAECSRVILDFLGSDD